MKMLMRHILLSAIAIVIFLCSQQSVAQVNTDNLMRMGQNAISAEDYLLAIQHFNLVIQARPGMHKAYFGRGLAKYQLEDYAGAEADFSRALYISPFYPEALRMRGASRLNLGEYGAAAEDFGEYLKEYPRDKNIIYHRGVALVESKDYAEADTVFGRVIELDPSFGGAYFGRAMGKLALSDTIAAKSYLEKGLVYNPDDFWANATIYTIAVAYEKNDTLAAAALDRLVEIEPDNIQVRFARSAMRFTNFEYSDAIDDLSHIIELDPDNDIALYNRAMIRVDLYDLDNALTDFSNILRLDPSNDFAIYNRAAIYATKGDYRKAIEDMTRFIKIYPDVSSGYFTRSDFYLKIGDQRRAKADYDKALALADSRRPIRHRVRKKSIVETKIDNLKSNTETEVETEELTPEEFERRLSTIITVDDPSQLADKYEESTIRGLLQNRNYDIDIEPMMQLSYYPTVSELRLHTYYIKEIDDINNTHLTRHPIFVEIHPPMLDLAAINEIAANIEYYNSVISTNEPRAIDYIDRAINLIMMHNTESAINDIDRAIELTPDQTVAYMLRAQARNFDKTSDTPRPMILKLIIADLNKAVELSPRNAVAWYNLGNAFFESGDYNEACNAYSSAIAHQPDMGEAYFNRGYARLKLGKYPEGKADLSKAGELGVLPSYNLLKRIMQK